MKKRFWSRFATSATSQSWLGISCPTYARLAHAITLAIDGLRKRMMSVAPVAFARSVAIVSSAQDAINIADSDEESGCEHCENASCCCHCRTCQHGSCNRLVECSREDCEECDRHHSCQYCESCDHTYDGDQSFCCDCTYCESCCSCNSDENDDEPEEIREGKPWKATSPKMRKVFRSQRLVGVEWEYNQAERGSVESWSHKWRGGIHSDGSCGWEAVTAPMSGDYIEKCLTDLGKAFADGGAEVNSQCGIHVHVDAADVSWNDMYRFLWAYSQIEPLLFLLAGQSRIDNQTYCAPIGQAYKQALGHSLALNKPNHATDGRARLDIKDAVLRVALGQSSGRTSCRRHRPHKKDAGRYRSLNVMPWLAGKWKKAPDSTIEFRLHMHSLDPKRVIAWTQLCARLVDWAVKATDAEAEALPKSALRALCQIAPESKPWILERVRAWRYYYTFHSGRARRIHLKKGRYYF